MAWSRKKGCKRNKILALHYRGVSPTDICERLDTKRDYVLTKIRRQSCEIQKATYKLTLSMCRRSQYSNNEMDYGTIKPQYNYEELKHEVGNINPTEFSNPEFIESIKERYMEFKRVQRMADTYQG